MLGIPLVIGIVGGVALIAASELSTPMVGLIIYALSVVVAAAYVRANRIPSFGKRFEAVLIAFVVESILFYGFIIGQNITQRAFYGTLPGHLWRLAFIVTLGAAISAVMALFTRVAPRRVS